MIKEREKRERHRSEESPFEQKVLYKAKVVQVTGGGRRFSFVCLNLVRNRKDGAVGMAYSQGKEMLMTIRKSYRKAMKESVVFFKDKPRTIPYSMNIKFNATRLILKPAPSGTGIKAGGVLNPIFKFLGMSDVSAKIIGSRNKINVARCFFMALNKFTGKRRFF